MSEAYYPKNTDTLTVAGIVFTHADIQNVVDDFYTQIQYDLLLEVPFRSVHDWPEHIQRLTHFWWIRFGGRPYLFTNYNPVMKHFFAGFNAELLTRWLALFHKTMKKHLTQEQQDFWTDVSEKMGQSLSFRNDLMRKEHGSGQKD